MQGKKIKVAHPIVELSGDEMAQVIWQWVKKALITPFLDLNLKTIDLGLANRQKTGNQIVDEAIKAIKQAKVSVKCPNISPTCEMGCASAKIMNSLGGTSFTEVIELKKVPKLIPGWTKPIVIARHCFGDQYLATELATEAGKFELVFESKSGKQQRWKVFDFKGPGVAMAFLNTQQQITQFAHTCLKYALYRVLPLYFTTKNTILKKYDGRFKDTFQALYDKEYKKLYEAKKIWYEHRLIDDMVAYMMKSDGGYVWACKNYDGDVEINCVAQGYGSNALAVSSLINGDGVFLSEPVHGTVSRHYKCHQKGEETSSNPIGTILAWCKALAYRAKLDNNTQLAQFSAALETSVIQTVEKGFMTRDLATIVHGCPQIAKTKSCSTTNFIEKVAERLRLQLNSSKI